MVELSNEGLLQVTQTLRIEWGALGAALAPAGVTAEEYRALVSALGRAIQSFSASDLDRQLEREAPRFGELRAFLKEHEYAATWISVVLAALALLVVPRLEQPAPAPDVNITVNIHVEQGPSLPGAGE